ncbi:hypothetical protein [Pseudomonas sp. TH31]|uniref:hypothetical protein n=1 Tax=Pseudomonas sp. TH31 TaxID=2796396 RepID=UPI001912FA2C|nr:hypothetical protein [Pseudomonas sp. TH31]MBK5417732.1 hypothetical protein [Pseudomonas sp. TH31]
MNILGRNLLSLTVYHLRRVVYVVIGLPVIDSVTTNPDGTVVVGGSGGTPGQTIVITFPDGSVGTGIVGNGGGWSVTSPGVVAPVPRPEDLVVDQVPTPDKPTVPEPGEVKPGEGGGTVIGGGGANPGDDVEVTLPGGETGSGEAGEDGDWEVEFPDVPYDPELDPGDVGVITNPKPGEPVVEDVTPNSDGTVTVGGGANPGDQITVTFPDGSTGTGTADENGDWTVVSPGAQSPDLGVGDVTVIAKPDPMAGSISAPDAVYADIAGLEFVEVDDAGNYIAWEELIEQMKKIVGVSATASVTSKLGYNGGYAKSVIKVGSAYLVTFDFKIFIFDSLQDLSSGTARVIEKNYLHNGYCGVFKTNHTGYYLRSDGGRNRLVRFDGADTGLVFDVVNDNVPDIVSLGSVDWMYNSDFSISYLIDPVTLSVTPGPVFNDISLSFAGYSGWAANGAGRTFITAESNTTGYSGVYEVSAGGAKSLVVEIPGELTAGDKYLYIKSGTSVSRVTLGTMSVTEFSLGHKLLEGYSRGDFAVFRNSESSVTVTYDAGVTFEKIFVIQNDASLMWVDMEDDRLVLTRNYREFDLLEYQLIEE